MRKRFLIPLAMLFLSVAAYADTTPATPTAATPAVTKAVPSTPASVAATLAPEVQPVSTPDVVKVDGDKVTVNDIVTDATAVAAAIQAYKTDKAAGDKTATRLGLMLLLAAIFKVLLSVVKFTSDFWKGPKGALALRVSTLVLGIAVFLTAKMGAGETVVNSALLALSGPLAISFHELFDIIVNLVQKTPTPPVAPAAPLVPGAPVK